MKTTRREALLGLLGVAAAAFIPKSLPALAPALPTFEIPSELITEPTDILKDKYQMALQEIMEAEDRIWLDLTKKAKLSVR